MLVLMLVPMPPTQFGGDVGVDVSADASDTALVLMSVLMLVPIPPTQFSADVGVDVGADASDTVWH
jgi:hypothetical protein